MYLPRLQNVGFDKSATEIKYDGIVIAAIKLKYCMLAGAFPTHSFFPTILPVFYQLFFFNIQLPDTPTALWLQLSMSFRGQGKSGQDVECIVLP